MYGVRPATPGDLARVIELITRLQADPAHNIAFHGESAEEVTEELAGLGADWASVAVVAVDRNERLRGVLSVAVDGEQHRAYLHGPYVDVPANHPAAGQLWQQTSDALFEHLLALPAMSEVSALDLAGDRRNRLLADFAARHDIPAGDISRLFTLTGEGLRALLHHPVDGNDRVSTLPDDPAVRDAVTRLHDSCFPTAPTPGRSLVSGRTDHTVVVLLGDGLLGYAAGFPQAEEYYLDFVAVDPSVRAVGAGRLLVRRLLQDLAARAGGRNRAAAMIKQGNDPSERMFTALGFTPHTEFVLYRRTGFRAEVSHA